jgi:rubrerythrin
MRGGALDASMTPAQLLEAALASERETRALLLRAAALARDPGERALLERLAGREQENLRELERERELLEAAEFVQRALDC